MQLKDIEKKIVLESIISYESLKKRNAFQIIADIRKTYSDYGEKLGICDLETEEDFQKWLGFDNKNEYTIEEFIKLEKNPHLIMWAILSEEVLPAHIIHNLSMGYAKNFLKRLYQKSVFIDYRFKKLINTKQRWIDNEASLGELKAAQRKALEIYIDSHHSNDKNIISSSQAVYSAILEKPVASVRGVFKATEQVFDVKRETIRRLHLFKEALKEV